MAEAEAGEQMDVDPVPGAGAPPEPEPEPAHPAGEEEEEDIADLVAALESVDGRPAADRISTLSDLLGEPRDRYGPAASALKERAVYALARAYCEDGRHDAVVGLLTGDTCAAFFAHVTKAKTAKVVRAVLDAVCALSPDRLDMQAEICGNIIAWCRSEKRTFLRQRVEAKLAAVLFAQDR